jgi:N6-L-threonylcarbamoyladenine synthase
MMKILAIETSCDETAAAVVCGLDVLSSVKYTQEIHSKYGGVVPSLAKRGHEERIDQIIALAMKNAQITPEDLGAIAVTVGPGLAIALGVGIEKAKELANKWNKPIVEINHVEGHLLSQLITAKQAGVELAFPALGLVVSGGHTQVIKINSIGDYEILMQSLDDDIGEAIDKGARMLGLPYPGGPALEQAAAKGSDKKYPLPLPMARREGIGFSYSGLKTAMWRLVEKLKVESGSLSEDQVNDLATSFQTMVFKHLVRTLQLVINKTPTKDLLVGGGVAANQTLRRLLNELGTKNQLKVWFPPDLVMCTDNAAMIGVVAGFRAQKGLFAEITAVDRKPRLRVDQSIV